MFFNHNSMNHKVDNDKFLNQSDNVNQINLDSLALSFSPGESFKAAVKSAEKVNEVVNQKTGEGLV